MRNSRRIRRFYKKSSLKKAIQMNKIQKNLITLPSSQSQSSTGEKPSSTKKQPKRTSKRIQIRKDSCKPRSRWDSSRSTSLSLSRLSQSTPWTSTPSSPLKSWHLQAKWWLWNHISWHQIKISNNAHVQSLKPNLRLTIFRTTKGSWPSLRIIKVKDLNLNKSFSCIALKGQGHRKDLSFTTLTKGWKRWEIK